MVAIWYKLFMHEQVSLVSLPFSDFCGDCSLLLAAFKRYPAKHKTRITNWWQEETPATTTTTTAVRPYLFSTPILPASPFLLNFSNFSFVVSASCGLFYQSPFLA